jgi:hypothetical protein
MRWTRQCQKTNDADPPSQSFGGTGTKTVERLLRKAFADGEVVWS